MDIAIAVSCSEPKFLIRSFLGCYWHSTHSAYRWQPFVHYSCLIHRSCEKLPSACQSRSISCKYNQLGAQLFLICLLLFSTCFGQLCAHRQVKIPYLCDTWYFHSIWTTVRYAGRNENCFHSACIPDSHLYRVTNTRCRVGTLFSPDDGHIVARNM